MTRSVRARLRAGAPLAGISPSSSPGVKREKQALEQTAALATTLADLQEQLFANGKTGSTQRLLLVLQSMDAGGKDGAVKHVVGQMNPAGLSIVSFGAPTKAELKHDFLWRIQQQVPAPGLVGVFNRSHYEDVLIVKVHQLVAADELESRYDRINAWEAELGEQGVALVKVFLHLSYDEQKARLLARLDDTTKHWKVGPADVTERARWHDYQAAYAAALERCNPDSAPWYVVPADHKWYRDWAITQLLVETLTDLHLTWPEPEGLDLAAIRSQLLAT